MKKVLALAVMAGFLSFGCATPGKEGVIRLQGWKLPKGKVAGYNIYMSKGKGHAFEQINEGPVVGNTIEVGNLEPGQPYWFRMTMVSDDIPPRETKPGKVWSRKAIERVAGDKK